jgi:hypothetical protein
MQTALQSCKSAGTRRTDLVHGIFDYENGRITLERRGKATSALTLARIESATLAVFEALTKTVNAFTALWDLTKGEFPPYADAVLQTTVKSREGMPDPHYDPDAH